MIRQIITSAIEDDGIGFTASSVHAEESCENQEYGDIRINFSARLDEAQRAWNVQRHTWKPSEADKPSHPLIEDCGGSAIVLPTPIGPAERSPFLRT